LTQGTSRAPTADSLGRWARSANDYRSWSITRARTSSS
jgi:hypothetical protein